MLLDVTSATAYAPPPIAALYELAGRHGVRSARSVGLRGPVVSTPNTSATTTTSGELVLQIASERSASVADKARMAIEISNRLQFLEIAAEIDSIPFSEASLRDFQALMGEIGHHSRPSLFLNDNGNLRALWKNGQHEQIGLQFLGDGNVQFVIFKQRKGTLAMARVAGIDAKEKILGHIKASGAETLL